MVSMNRFLGAAILAIVLATGGCGAGDPPARVILLGLDGMDGEEKRREVVSSRSIGTRV